jgi:hypothetical protein
MTTPPLIKHEPKDMTADEEEAVIRWFATLPVAELRHRQELVFAQQRTAHATRNDRALANLAVMERDLASALRSRH